MLNNVRLGYGAGVASVELNLTMFSISSLYCKTFSSFDIILNALHVSLLCTDGFNKPWLPTLMIIFIMTLIF